MAETTEALRISAPIWNAAIEAVHRLVDEASSGHGPLWYDHDDGKKPDGGDVLDRLPNAIWQLRR